MPLSSPPLPLHPTSLSTRADADKSAVLTIELDAFELPVIAPLHPAPVVVNEMQVGAKVAANMIPQV